MQKQPSYFFCTMTDVPNSEKKGKEATYNFADMGCQILTYQKILTGVNRSTLVLFSFQQHYGIATSCCETEDTKTLVHLLKINIKTSILTYY